MPYSTERGSSHSPTSAPSSVQRSIARRTAAATPGSMPSASFSSLGTPMRSPFRSSASGSSTGGTSTVVESHSSRPLMIPYSSALSRTVFVTGPTWSRLDANATMPYRDTVPYVGRSPTRPHSAAGCLIEPPVSDPSAHGARPPATAAVEPPDEPPGTRVGSHGLRDGPKPEFSVDEPIANSSMLVLPRKDKRASRQRVATVAS